MIEYINSANDRIAIIISSRFTHKAEADQFVTENSDALQVGTIVRKAGDKISPHFHHQVELQKGQKQEFILVISGSVTISFYDQNNNLIAERILLTGDSMLQLSGGHGFVFNEDTRLLEVKQGPYLSKSEDKSLI